MNQFALAGKDIEAILLEHVMIYFLTTILVQNVLCTNMTEIGIVSTAVGQISFVTS